jgi:hypothetical protein
VGLLHEPIEHCYGAHGWPTFLILLLESPRLRVPPGGLESGPSAKWRGTTGSTCEASSLLAMEPTNSFAFEKLRQGQLGISAVCGGYLTEAAEFCLHHNGHARPVLVHLTGDLCNSASLEWAEIDANLLGRTHGDLKRAVEDGAYAVAIVFATETTGMKGAMKSPQS